MSDHRDGPRLVNALFPVFERLPPRQRAVLIDLMGGPGMEDSGLSREELAEEVEEARAHFLAKLASKPGRP